MNLTPARGVLLYGPPGCCKTTLVKAVATSTHAAFFSLSGAQIFSAYVGGAEEAIRDVFTKARRNHPAVIFFDEIESMVGSRGDGSNVCMLPLGTFSLVTLFYLLPTLPCDLFGICLPLNTFLALNSLVLFFALNILRILRGTVYYLPC